MEYTSKRHKTEKRIAQAFLDLYAEKDMRHISVRELCQMVEINRSTFYSHYLDVYDLLEKIEDQVLETGKEIFTSMVIEAGKQPISELIGRFLAFVQKDNNMLMLLMRKGNLGFRTKIIGILTDVIRNKKSDLTDDDIHFISYCLTYHLAAVSEVINKWHDEGRVVKLSIVMEEILEIAQKGVFSVLSDRYFVE